MPRPRKHEQGAKREAPVQFRLESDLGRLVHGFAERHGLGTNEAAKALIALAVAEMDGRYYGLVRQMADAIGGAQPFVAACLRVNAALEGAAVATGRPYIPGARPAFIVRVVEGVLADRGKRVDPTGLGFLIGEAPVAVATAEEVVATAQVDLSAKKKRTIRRVED